MQYYTYKITFKDLPCYFYYGKHKDDGKPYYGSPKTWKHLWDQFEPEIQVLQWHETDEDAYAAECSIILATWKDKYSLNEAVGARVSERVCSDNGRKTVKAMNAHPNTEANRSETAKAMNAHPNTAASRSDNGKKTGPETVKTMNAHPNTEENRKCVAMNAHPNTGRNRSKTVETMNAHPNTIANRVENGRKNAGALNSHPNTRASQVENAKRNGEKASKRVLLTHVSTGNTFEFPSLCEAARVLKLDDGHLSKVAKGKSKQHKGYTAVYL
jgi:hypothetical protein